MGLILSLMLLLLEIIELIYNNKEKNELKEIGSLLEMSYMRIEFKKIL
jgi:hypothetical protein